MPTAILIGFEYEINSLTGTFIDLYLAHRWCNTFNCDTHILTDIESVKNIGNLEHAIHKKIVDSNILTFYNKSNFNIIREKLDLFEKLRKSLDIKDNKLIIYFSGHGLKESIILPDKTLLPFVELRDIILENLSPETEIFWILDCCNPNGIHLPFKLVNNSFKLSSYKIECVSQRILLITSSETYEKSIATKLGSLFSRNLFRLLTIMNDGEIYTDLIPIDKNRNLRRLIGNISSSIRKMHTGYTQTISIYSSYIMDPVLWLWIGKNRDYDIYLDSTLSVFIIK